MVKIFYVEDEPFLAKIVRETLESKGYDVCHVADGNKAIAAFQDYQPDICVLDVMLPGRDGFDIGRDIRAQHRALPIIYLTAKDQTQDVVTGFGAGGNDYIKKPFSMEELMVRINNLLTLVNQQLKEQLSETIQIGEISYNRVKMELHSPAGLVRLSHRENEIMTMICSSLNGQVKRQDILLQIWGDDSFFNSRNLDVYIRKIRTYLSADPTVELITLKGIGYRLVR